MNQFIDWLVKLPPMWVLGAVFLLPLLPDALATSMAHTRSIASS